jgi:hypothetical protein
MLALMLHMEFRFGYTGLTAGEVALVKVRFADRVGGQRDAVDGQVARTAAVAASLETDHGLRAETPAVVLPSAREIAWRIRPRAAGSYELRVRIGDSVLTKTVVVSDGVARRSPVRPASGFLHQLRYPSEEPLPSRSGLTAITVAYPERPFSIGGWNIGWSGVYLALTVILALALKSAFGVAM